MIFNIIATLLICPWLSKTANPITRFSMVSLGGYLILMMGTYLVRTGHLLNMGGSYFFAECTVLNILFNVNERGSIIFLKLNGYRHMPPTPIL